MAIKTITYQVEVTPKGSKFWYLNGQRHREGGPAIEYANGDKEWYIDGVLHREDGPAIEYADGEKSYWLYGVHHSKKEFPKKLKWYKLTKA